MILGQEGERNKFLVYGPTTTVGEYQNVPGLIAFVRNVRMALNWLVGLLVVSVGTGDSPLTRRVIVEVMFELTINERFKLSFRKGLARLQC